MTVNKYCSPWQLSAAKNGTLRSRLECFINHRYTDVTVIVLILFSISLLVIETILVESQQSDLVAWCLYLSDVITWVFIVELSIRFYTFGNKRRFFRVYWLDILAVLPIFRPLRALRILRLLRIFRMGLLLNRRISTVSMLFREGMNEYMIVFLIIIMIVLSSSIAIRFIEGGNTDFQTFESTLWWSILSMIAGEPINGTPMTIYGKIITVIIMLGGLTLFAVFTGVVSAVMVQKLRGGISVKEFELEELHDHIIICGWNRSASMIIEEFQSDPVFRTKPIVIIAELDDDPLHQIRDVDPNLLYILREDYTQINVLKKARVDRASTAILLPDKSRPRSDQDRDARTVLAALIIEKLNKSIFTCVELLNRDNETHLQLAGVEEIFVSDEYAGSIIASSAKNHGITSVVDEIFSSKYGNQMYKIPITDPWIGKTSLELFVWLKEKHNAILLSVHHHNGSREEQTLVNPDTDYRFREDDLIIVIATKPVSL